MDLISAGGRQGAALANAARGGALARKIAAQQQALTSLQAHLTAWWISRRRTFPPWRPAPCGTPCPRSRPRWTS